MNIREVEKTPFDHLPADLKDAAKRSSDIINLHLVAQGHPAIKDKYIAIKLGDGDSDGVLYDTHRDAVRHQLHYTQCYYVSFRSLVGGTTPRDMAILIQFARDAYEAGARFTDPDDVNGGRQLVLTAGIVDAYKRDMGLF